MAGKQIGFIFSVNTPTEFSGKPTQKNVSNSFDLIGDLLSIKRLEAENNSTFKQRILDVRVHPGGPDYFGIINNLTREFGFTRTLALTIDIKKYSSGETIAPNPRVDFLANKVILYSDWRPGVSVIDREIRIYQPEDTGYFISGLIAAINESPYFSASIASSARTNWHSTNLLRETSDVFVYNYPLSANNRNFLEVTNIVQDSIVFYEPSVFYTEVSIDPSSVGEYKIDREDGIIYSYSLPSGTYGVDFHYAKFPLEIDYSPIKIYTLNDDDFTYELFQHETIDSGEVVNRLPNTEGSEIYHQLYKETEVFWGK